MVGKSKKNATAKEVTTLQSWMEKNPVEADIIKMFAAAENWASSQVEYIYPDEYDPEEPLERVNDELTDLEMSISRAKFAVFAMMNTAEGRKAAGLRPRVRGRDKSYDPHTVDIDDPQVKVIFRLCRNEITREQANSEVTRIISPKGEIDPRTLKAYVDFLIDRWSWHAKNDHKIKLIATNK